jgi:hypothetical protein
VYPWNLRKTGILGRPLYETIYFYLGTRNPFFWWEFFPGFPLILAGPERKPS